MAESGVKKPENHWEDCSGELAKADPEPPASHSNVTDLIPESIRERAGTIDSDDFESQVAELREEETRRIHRERMDAMVRKTIPKRYQADAITLDSYECTRREQEQAIRTCRSYVDSFPDRLADGQGLLLYGKPGTGKTHIACSVAKAVIRRNHSVVYTSVIEMMRRIKETYRSDSVKTEGQVIQSYLDPDLLVLEEIGVQHHTEAERVKMFEVIDGRYNQDKPFILISNLGNQNLAKCLSEKVWDRVQERCVMLAFTWESYRTRGRHG